MELAAVLLMAAVGPTVFAWGVYQWARRRARLQVEGLRRVAEVVGLEDIEVAWLDALGPATRLTGRHGALQVEMSTRLHSRSELVWGLAVGRLGHRENELLLHSEDLGASIAKTLGSREIEVGDPAFDDQMYVRGSPSLALAVFDSDTRVQTLGLFSEPYGRVWLSEGVLRYERVGGADVPVWVELTLPPLLEVARRLARPADPAGRLAANARQDPLSAVRLANLRALVRDYRNRPAAREALRHALRDSDPGIRLRAARELGDEGRQELLRLALDTAGSEEVQAVAIRVLGGRLPIDEGEPILRQALRARRLQVAEACLEALAHHGERGVVELLGRVLAVERGALAVAAARALGASGEPLAEAPLAAALDRRDEGVAVAVAEALGGVGTAAVIPSLRAMESGSDDEDLRRAARKAVARIQERLTGASPGQLSLAGRESGQLSLTEDERGRVAIHDDEGRGEGGGRR
jgi:HEAT repeat protein